MNLNFVPLLRIQRELQRMPRSRERFEHYLRTISNDDGTDIELVPLLAMNPMGRDHVTAVLDALLAFDADGVAAREVAEASASMRDLPGDYRAALVVADDRGGGWTNRWSYEFDFRIGCGPFGTRPQDRRRFWVTGLLWSSETPAESIVRETMRAAAHRTAYLARHGPARTLRAILDQEGHALARAGCTGPVLDVDDLACTREVIAPHLDDCDMRTAIECLFGDVAARSLGFTPRGLSPWAGLALALHDARSRLSGEET